MSFTINSDILVHFQRIDNFSCFIPGQYKLEVMVLIRLQNLESKVIESSIIEPYYLPFCESNDNLSSSDMPSISRNISKYNSQIFNFETPRESINLNQSVLFRFDHAIKIPFYCLELQVSILGNKNNKKPNFSRKQINSIDSNEFEIIYTNSVAIRNSNINCRFPIDFFLGNTRTCILSLVFSSYTICLLTRL